MLQTPFGVCADTKSRSVVVTIRGSMSLRDALTDLVAHDEPLPLDELSLNGYETRRSPFQQQLAAA